MCRRQNLEIVFGFKSDTGVFTISFRFLSSPQSTCSFALLASFVSFAWPLVGIILVGTVFEKAFRILGLDERKSRWVVKEDFHGFEIFGYVMVFCLFFSSLLLVGFERSLHPAQVRGQKCPWPLKLMFTGGRRDVDLHRWFWTVQG